MIAPDGIPKRRDRLRIGLGLGLPPAAWAVCQQLGSDLNYADCANSWAPALIAGVFALAVIGLSGGLAFSGWRAARPHRGRAPEPVWRFLAALGLMLSGLLFLTVSLQILAVLLAPTCFR